MIEVRTATDDEFGSISQVLRGSLATAFDGEQQARERAMMDLDRFRVAIDSQTRQLIGVGGSYDFELTVPGGSAVDLGGVGWIAVSVTHRRQGVLTRLMDEIHADIDARGEPLAGLGASEGEIYGRFGYTPATKRRAVRIDRRLVAFQDRSIPHAGTVSLMAADDPVLPRLLADRWDRYRRACPGEINRPDARQRALMAERGSLVRYAIHDDGYAAWTVTARSVNGLPEHELEVLELASCSAEAHDELWATVLAVDLVGHVIAPHFPLDDPLPYLLTNYRAVQTVGLADMLWLNVRDVPASFGARIYGTDDEIVMEAGGVRWMVGNGTCRRVRRRADIVVDRNLLGALLLGGVSPTTLAAAHLLEARSAETLRRADAAFRANPEPNSQTSF